MCTTCGRPLRTLNVLVFQTLPCVCAAHTNHCLQKQRHPNKKQRAIARGELIPVRVHYGPLGERVIICSELPDTVLHRSSVSQTHRENRDGGQWVWSNNTAQIRLQVNNDKHCSSDKVFDDIDMEGLSFTSGFAQLERAVNPTMNSAHILTPCFGNAQKNY